MSRAAEITLAFGGEERLFRLPLGRLRALQEKTDCGPLELLQRYAMSTWRVDDVREAILQGLMGGGLPSHQATSIVMANFDDMPIMGHVAIAQAIVAAAVVGVGDEEPGEIGARGEKTSRSRAARSGSRRSTEPAPQ